MTIRELFDQPGVHLSCEVFPPKVFDKVEEAKAAVRDICALSPAYVSVTCGASGSTPQFTREISAYVQEHGVTALSHLTCVGDTRDQIDAVLDGLAQAGIRNVLALRGDLPEGMSFPGEEHFRYAAELIAAIRSRGAFCVGAACYPEGHPESPDGIPIWTICAASRMLERTFLPPRWCLTTISCIAFCIVHWPGESTFPSRRASCPWSMRGRFAALSN